MTEEKQTIEEELEVLGVEINDFRIIYNEISYQHTSLEKEAKEATYLYIFDEAISTEQQDKIFKYLKEKQVLDEDGHINDRGYTLFDARKDLEDRLAGVDFFTSELEPSGGVLPCQSYEDSDLAPTGGFMPCR
jgi:hypothetical protein